MVDTTPPGSPPHGIHEAAWKYSGAAHGFGGEEAGGLGDAEAERRRREAEGRARSPWHVAGTHGAELDARGGNLGGGGRGHALDDRPIWLWPGVPPAPEAPGVMDWAERAATKAAPFELREQVESALPARPPPDKFILPPRAAHQRHKAAVEPPAGARAAADVWPAVAEASPPPLLSPPAPDVRHRPPTSDLRPPPTLDQVRVTDGWK